MYLVNFDIFNTFIKKNELDKKEPPIIEDVPFILEYKRNGAMMAKIEMSSINEFKFFKRYPNIAAKKTDSKNKYWIRGNEWEIVNGKTIEKLCIT